VGAYPAEVHHRVRRDEPGDYVRAARLLRDCVDVVSIQHGDEIWGGPDGQFVLDFADALDIPAVATLHTVSPSPTEHERAILLGLIDRVESVVVMSQAAASLLATSYGVDPARIAVIPYGVPDLPMIEPALAKDGLQLGDRRVVLSFGLLRPDKGFELALQALPAIIKAHPTTRYVIVGATHPAVLARDGEAYRDSLAARAAKLGLKDNVVFVNRYVGRVELTRWLQAADVFVAPAADLGQLASGTLAYAMAAGRAIVSTPTACAAELLADGRGLLVEPVSAAALAASINDVLADDELRRSLGRHAHDFSRQMLWPRVAASYGAVFERAAASTGFRHASRSFAAVPGSV
jgi:glycosyltransferase involved in cell wall biosynthesis